MNNKLEKICPDLDNNCIDRVKKKCPAMDSDCLESLSQMDYLLIGKENFNLSKEQMEKIEQSCKNPLICTQVYQTEKGYLDLLKDIMNKGMDRTDRTGVGTRSIFHANLAFDLSKGFPALTTKKLFWKGVMGELLWFLSGKNDLSSLRKFTFGKDEGQKTIWDIDFSRWNRELEYRGEAVNENEGGAIYGTQWRNFSSSYSDSMNNVDQIREILHEAKQNPSSRRLLVNAWNAADVFNNNMALPPCHMSFQLYIECGKVNIKWNQRSVDCFLGLPFNLASYSMLCHIFAKWLSLDVGWVIGDLTNVHIYNSHINAIRKQLSNYTYPLCQAPIIPEGFSLDTVDNYTAEDFPLINYASHETIKAPMAG